MRISACYARFCRTCPTILLALLIAFNFTIITTACAQNWPLPAGHTLPATCRKPDMAKGNAVAPYLLHKLPLEDISFYAKGGCYPDTFLRFAPDSRKLAVGTFLGRLLLLDIYAGKLLWDKKIAEGMVKKIDFSPDGETLYFGEQSVDGFVYAADAATGAIRWRFRLADDLETSAPPGKDEVYGIYSLPGCYRLKVLDNGDIIVLGIHSWGDIKNLAGMRRLARVYRFSPKGKLRWAFPADGPAPMVLIYLDVDPAGRRVGALVGQHGSNTPEDAVYKTGSLLVLDGADGKLIASHTFEPLKPYFETVHFWQSISVGPRGELASIGMNDGRTFLIDLDTAKPVNTYNFGAPIVISGVPVSARATYTRIAPDRMIYFQTENSNVPNANTMEFVVDPPGPHPRANTINVVDPDGRVRWRYRSGHCYQNFWTSGDGRWVMTPVKRDDKIKGRESGAILFDTRREGGGSAKFVYLYTVEGLAFFQADMAADGSAFALCETPFKDPQSGLLTGAYQVHVVR